ncbi:MAG: hypothetical protein ACC657_17960 [Thiohalomonadales bacterium]
MAKLNQIEIRESRVTYTNKRDWFFHPTGHHVRELLEYNLPTDFILDGSSKLSIIFGERPKEKKIYNNGLGGVSIYYIDDFDIEQYMKQPVEVQQEVILDVVTRAMVDIAKNSGADIEVIQAASDKVRSSGFSSEIEIKKLSRSTRDRKIRVSVFRCLGPKIGEVWETRIKLRNGCVLSVEKITNSPSCLDRTSHFSKSRWEGNIFQIIYSRLQKITYELDISKYIELNR